MWYYISNTLPPSSLTGSFFFSVELAQTCTPEVCFYQDLYTTLCLRGPTHRDFFTPLVSFYWAPLYFSDTMLDFIFCTSGPYMGLGVLHQKVSRLSGSTPIPIYKPITLLSHNRCGTIFLTLSIGIVFAIDEFWPPFALWVIITWNHMKLWWTALKKMNLL